MSFINRATTGVLAGFGSARPMFAHMAGHDKKCLPVPAIGSVRVAPVARRR
jgi:hypothetical protein